MASAASQERPARTLWNIHRIEIAPTSPYSFQGSVFKPSHFRTTDCATVGRRFWQTLRIDNHAFGVRLTGNDNVWHPKVRAHIYGATRTSPAQIARLTDLLRRRYDMESDIRPFHELVNRTPRRRATLLRWMGSRPTCAHSLYELLVVLICLQNARVRRTEAMMQSLFESYGRQLRFEGHSLWSFWPPKALVGQEGRLRELRLGYRARSLDRLSRFLSSVDRDFEVRLRALSDEDLRKALQEIPGVGPATAGGLMLDYFHRYDALDYLPPWETKIFRRVLSKPHASSEQLVTLARRTWPGYSMLALHLLLEDQFWRRLGGLPNSLAGLAPP